jgi:hypothetical protein
MTDWLLVLLTAILLTFNVSAQIASMKEHPARFDESRKIWEEVVENQDSDSRPIVAVHATFHCQTEFPLKSGRYKTFRTTGEYDALGNGVSIFQEYQGIPPGGGARIQAADPSKCSGGVDAVIFSDGQIDGNAGSLSDYRQRWIGVHEGVSNSLPLLAKVVNQEADLAEAEDALRRRMESIPDHSPDLKTFYERGIYLQLESLLRDAREHPKPRSEEVEANGIPRKQGQKMAIFLVNKLQDWKTALEHGLGMPPTTATR